MSYVLVVRILRIFTGDKQIITVNKLFIVAFATFLAAWACTPKAIPVLSDRARIVDEKPVSVGINIKPDTLKGHALFMNRCGRCHVLPDPAAYTTLKWNAILDRMIPRARMDTVEGVHVKAFILSGIQ